MHILMLYLCKAFMGVRTEVRENILCQPSCPDLVIPKIWSWYIQDKLQQQMDKWAIWTDCGFGKEPLHSHKIYFFPHSDT